MLTSIISTISTNPYISYPLITVGAIAILSKVSKVALPIFKKIATAIYNSIPSIRVRSIFCKECAERHKIHVHFPTKNGEEILLYPLNNNKSEQITEE